MNHTAPSANPIPGIMYVCKQVSIRPKKRLPRRDKGKGRERISGVPHQMSFGEQCPSTLQNQNQQMV